MIQNRFKYNLTFKILKLKNNISIQIYLINQRNFQNLFSGTLNMPPDSDIIKFKILNFLN